MIACTVLAVAVTGIAVALAASHQHARYAEERGLMLQVARVLLEEVAATPFLAPAIGDQPGYAAGETDRSRYDDVFDYHGFQDAVPLEDRTTTVYSSKDVPRVTRRVSVQPRTDLVTPAATKADANFAYVEVTVVGPYGDTMTLPYWQSRTVWRR